jgi:Gas vesicle protein
MPDQMNRLVPGSSHTASLVDILDRVLDKGLVVAGDIKISLAEVELLTIRIRLLICSIDKAEQIGMDWWKYDKNLSPGRLSSARENEALKKQVRMLERKVAALAKPHRGPNKRRQSDLA